MDRARGRARKYFRGRSRGNNARRASRSDSDSEMPVFNIFRPSLFQYHTLPPRSGFHNYNNAILHPFPTYPSTSTLYHRQPFAFGSIPNIPQNQPQNLTQNQAQNLAQHQPQNLAQHQPLNQAQNQPQNQAQHQPQPGPSNRFNISYPSIPPFVREFQPGSSGSSSQDLRQQPNGHSSNQPNGHSSNQPNGHSFSQQIAQHPNFQHSLPQPPIQMQIATTAKDLQRYQQQNYPPNEFQQAQINRAGPHYGLQNYRTNINPCGSTSCGSCINRIPQLSELPHESRTQTDTTRYFCLICSLHFIGLKDFMAHNRVHGWIGEIKIKYNYEYPNIEELMQECLNKRNVKQEEEENANKNQDVENQGQGYENQGQGDENQGQGDDNQGQGDDNQGQGDGNQDDGDDQNDKETPPEEKEHFV